MAEALDEVVMATCPGCGAEVPDYDGFGVVAHVPGCGYCSHPSMSNVGIGRWICDLCEAVEVRTADHVNAIADSYATHPVQLDAFDPDATRRALCGDQSCEYAGSAFLCTTCNRLVCWCQGGDRDEVDPEGTMCCVCWFKAAEGIV